MNIVSQKLTASPESEIISELSVFPNPATDLLNVDLKGFEGNVTIEIFDFSGKRIYFQKTGEISTAEIKVSQFVQGVYLLRVNDAAGNSSTTKWIKQ